MLFAFKALFMSSSNLSPWTGARQIQKIETKAKDKRLAGETACIPKIGCWTALKLKVSYFPKKGMAWKNYEFCQPLSLYPLCSSVLTPRSLSPGVSIISISALIGVFSHPDIFYPRSHNRNEYCGHNSNETKAFLHTSIIYSMICNIMHKTHSSNYPTYHMYDHVSKVQWKTVCMTYRE